MPSLSIANFGKFNFAALSSTKGSAANAITVKRLDGGIAQSSFSTADRNKDIFTLSSAWQTSGVYTPSLHLSNANAPLSHVIQNTRTITWQKITAEETFTNEFQKSLSLPVGGCHALSWDNVPPQMYPQPLWINEYGFPFNSNSSPTRTSREDQALLDRHGASQLFTGRVTEMRVRNTENGLIT